MWLVLLIYGIYKQCSLSDNHSDDIFLYLETTIMENSTQTKPATNQQDKAEGNKAVLNDIRAKWDKFSEQDVSALKDNDDLVSKVSAKYGTKPDQAQRDVDAVLKGRKIRRRLAANIVPEAAPRGSLGSFSTRPEENPVAKGQNKSNREKKKPKQDKIKAPLPPASPFASLGPRGNPAQKGISKKHR